MNNDRKKELTKEELEDLCSKCRIHHALTNAENSGASESVCESLGVCPVAKAMFIFEGKWNIEVLYMLFTFHTLRFGELMKRVPGISKTMLTATLRKLEEHGLVNRRQFNEIPPHVEYSLTDGGEALQSVFEEIAKWSSVYLE